MPVTDVDVANMALGILDEASIDSLDEDTTAARLVNLHYDLTREAELTKHAWVFSIFSTSVDGTDTGSGTLNYAYSVPSDALRILPLTYDGEPSGIQISWRRDGNFIYTDQSSPRVIRYIANLIDPNDWDALFTEVFVAALAAKVAHPLTHKANMIQIAQQAYDRALDAALTANAIQRSGMLSTTSWAQQRGDNRYWRA